MNMVWLTSKNIIGELLESVVAGLPIVERPFKVIADSLGMGEDEVISYLRRLQSNGWLSPIEPVYDLCGLGYVVAMFIGTVSEEGFNIDQTVNVDGVSHAYVCGGYPQVVYVRIAVPSWSMVSKVAREIANRVGVGRYTVVKLLGEACRGSVICEAEGSWDKPTEEEWRIIEVAQGVVIPEREPFRMWSESLGISQRYLLDKLRVFRQRGWLKKISGSVIRRQDIALADIEVSVSDRNILYGVVSRISMLRMVEYCGYCDSRLFVVLTISGNGHDLGWILERISNLIGEYVEIKGERIFPVHKYIRNGGFRIRAIL